MAFNLQFRKQLLDCMVGGVSVLDIARLNVDDMEQARQFLQAYGYDLDNEQDREQLWSTHRRAVALIKDQLLDEGESIPEALFDPNQLTDLGQLLIYASSKKPGDSELRKWSCAILKVMHVYVHLRNDLFSAFSEEIQKQILKPFQDVIYSDPAEGSVIMGRTSDFEGIRLHKFEAKPFKTTSSSVIKLLARPEKVALTLLDKLGVRFVTRSVFDSFRVIRYLVESHIVSYPHIIPDQSNNSLYPSNLFFEAMDELRTKNPIATAEEIDELLVRKIQTSSDRAEYLEKSNEFSGSEYRFIKFINRKLITVNIDQSQNAQPFRFFYPYEIQIMDYNTFVNNLSGPMAHDEYKKRQRLAARERVLGVRNEK